MENPQRTSIHKLSTWPKARCPDCRQQCTTCRRTQMVSVPWVRACSTAQPRSTLAPIRSSHRPKTWSTPVNYSWGVCRNIQLSIHHFLKSPRVLTDQQGAPNSFRTLAPSRGCPCIPLQLGGSSSGAAAPRLPSAALQWLRSQRSGAM